jgi:hypothetical protein
VKVYVAGPYTQGDVVVNVRNAILAGDQLLEAGHFPYIPHLMHFWHLVTPHEYERWIAMDLEWLPVCEALVRLPGASSGSDGEVDAAQRLGIPVFCSVAEFLAELGGER